jgi:hypothetical protein
LLFAAALLRFGSLAPALHDVELGLQRVIVSRAPFHIVRVIYPASAQRDDVISLEAWTRAAHRASRRARVQPLELGAHDARAIGRSLLR